MDRYASHKRIVKRQFGGGFDYTSIFGIGDDEEETTTSTSTRTTARPDPETTTTVRTTSKEVEPTTEVTRTPVTTTTARTTETPETTSTTKIPETTRTTTPVTTSTTPTPTITSTTPTPTSTKVTPTTTSTSTTSTTTERTTTRSTSSSSSSSSSHSTSYNVPSSTSSVADPSATLAEGNNTEQTGGVSSGSIAGIVIGVLLGLAALGILIVFFVRRNRKKQEELNHFNASSFRRSAFLIDDGHEDFNPYAAAVNATQASALGRSPTTMTERQYGTMASVPTPGYPNTPYAQSPGYPIMQQPVNTFSPENYGYMEPVQQFAPNQYAGVGASVGASASASASNAAGFGAGNAAGFGAGNAAGFGVGNAAGFGAGNAAGFGAGNGAGVGAGMGMGSAMAIGGYYPSQGGPKALPDMPVSPNTQDNSFEGPFADSHHVIPAPLPVATAGGAVELERAYSVGSSHEHHYNSAPLNVANPDTNEPVRKLSVKRVPVPTEREEDPTAADLSAFPSPPVQSAPVALSPVHMTAPAPYSPAPYSPAPYSPAPYTLDGPIHEQQQHIAAPAPVQAPAPARSIPSVLTPGGSPSPKRETVYDPEDAYGGM